MTTFKKTLKDRRTCRIFFSSPFGGMEDEREELTRRYFPRIRHLCSSRGVQFVAVDMRWGITSDASGSAQVINICLRELDRSDMFVGFFGQRYGWFGADDKALQENFDNAVGTYPWLDRFRDKSVTELEFLHGHLNNPGDLPAVICFRDKAHDDLMKEDGVSKGDKKQVFKYSAESELSIQLMDNLKRRVEETRDKTLGVHMNYKDPLEGAELMFNAIWKHLKEVLLKDAKPESRFSRIKAEHDAFLSSRSLLYVGNDSILQQLTDNLNSENSVNYLITGPAGCGKSALLCTWLKQLTSQAYSDLYISYHFVGSAEESTSVRSMLIQIINGLEMHSGKDFDEKTLDKPDENFLIANIVNQFVVSLERILSLGKTPVLIVDGVDKIKKSTKVEKPMYWLPVKLPPGVKVIISTKSSDTENIQELVKERQYTQIEILDLNLESQKELCEKTLMQSGKELSPNQLQRIVEADPTKNPLYLKTTLHELVVFGYFRLLDKKIDSLISTNDVIELFDKVLERLEEDYNVKEYPGNLVEQALCSIISSINGLSETDIRTIHDIPAHIWSPLYFALQMYIIEQNGLIRCAFTELEDAISKRYLKQEQKREKYIRDVIHHFEQENNKSPMVFVESTVMEGRYAHELPWLYVKLGDLAGLEKSLLDLRIFKVLKKDTEFDTIELWYKTGKNWTEIVDLYMKQIDLLLIEYHQYIEDNFLVGLTPPILLVNSNLLDDLADMISYVSEYAALSLVERNTKVTLQAIERSPERFKEGDGDKVLYGLACKYCDCSQFKKSEEIHRKALKTRLERYKSDPSNKEVSVDLGKSYHGLATIYLKSKQYQQAEEYFLKAKELQDKYPEEVQTNDGCALLQNLGVVCLEQGRYEEAIQYNEQSLSILENLYFGHLPESVGKLLTNLGLCYRKQGQLEEAERIYQKSLDVKIDAVGYFTVDVAKSFMNFSVLESAKGDYNKAVEYAEKANQIFKHVGVAETDMEFMMTKENIILAYINLDRFDDALNAYRPWFKEAVASEFLVYSLPPSHFRIAQYLVERGEYQEAEIILLAVLELKEKLNPNYFTTLHRIDKALGKTDRKAEHSLEHGLQLFPHDPYIIEYIVKDVYVPQGQTDRLIHLLEDNQSIFQPERLYDAANTWFNQAGVGTYEMLIAINLSGLKFVPDNVMFMKNVAVGYQTLKNYESALPYCTKIVELEPDNPQNLFWVARCACLVGEFPLSQKHCQLIKEKFANEEDLISQVDMILNAIKEAEGQKSGENQDQGKPEDQHQGQGDPEGQQSVENQGQGGVES